MTQVRKGAINWRGPTDLEGPELKAGDPAPSAFSLVATDMSEVKGGDLWVYGAAGEADARSMGETDFAGGTAIVLGAEGKGLRPLVRRTCDALVSIPLAGQVESLNVSVAAAVLLYEARRQRG